MNPDMSTPTPGQMRYRIICFCKDCKVEFYYPWRGKPHSTHNFRKYFASLKCDTCRAYVKGDKRLHKKCIGRPQNEEWERLREMVRRAGIADLQNEFASGGAKKVAPLFRKLRKRDNVIKIVVEDAKAKKQNDEEEAEKMELKSAAKVKDEDVEEAVKKKRKKITPLLLNPMLPHCNCMKCQADEDEPFDTDITFDGNSWF